MFLGIGALLSHRLYCFHSQLCEPFSEVRLDTVIMQFEKTPTQS